MGTPFSKRRFALRALVILALASLLLALNVQRQELHLAGYEAFNAGEYA